MLSKKTMARIIKFLQWTRIVAKFAAIGTTIAGAVTAFSSSATTGFAIGAAGATSYAAAKTVPVHGYEKIKHVSPPRAIRQLKEAQRMVSEPSTKVGGRSTAKPVRMASLNRFNRKSG